MTLSKEQTEKLSAWLTAHDKDCHYADPAKCGANGGRLTYMFTPTSLGCVAKVKCACEAVVDLTSYEDW